jgi:ribosomal protein L24E
MPKCVYCGQVYEFPRGLTYVTKDGVAHYLCSSKCRKNMLMKRRKVNWIRKSDESKASLKKVSVKKNK